jgi:hypothetical protein
LNNQGNSCIADEDVDLHNLQLIPNQTHSEMQSKMEGIKNKGVHKSVRALVEQHQV